MIQMIYLEPHRNCSQSLMTCVVGLQKWLPRLKSESTNATNKRKRPLLLFKNHLKAPCLQNQCPGLAWRSSRRKIRRYLWRKMPSQKVKKIPMIKDLRIDHQSFYSILLVIALVSSSFITTVWLVKNQVNRSKRPTSLWPWSLTGGNHIQELRERQSS